jgi:glycosyltransferase involved in cell wall biosynthesis
MPRSCRFDSLKRRGYIVGGMRVSVVLPVYNGERYLREAIESVYAQTVRPREVVVVNDGSTDGTAVLLDELSESYLLTVVTRHRAGQAAARNAGVAAASGELIAFLDHDDVWHPLKLEWQTEQFAADRSLGMCFTATEHVGGLTGGGRLKEWDPKLALPRLLKGCVVDTPSTVMARREALREFVQIDPYGDDWLMWLELAAAGVRIGYLPEPLVGYRQHRHSISHATSHTAAACRVIPLFFKRNPQVPHGRYWRAHWHLLAAENGEGRLHLLKAAAIHAPSIRPGWLRLAITGRGSWAAG